MSNLAVTSGIRPRAQEAEIPEQRTNCMAKYVEWIGIEDDFTALRVATLYCAIVAVALVAYYGSVLLGLGIGIPLFSWYTTEKNHFQKVEATRARLTERREEEPRATQDQPMREDRSRHRVARHFPDPEVVLQRLERIRERARIATADQEASFRAIQEALGGEEAFNQLPVLDIGDRVGTTDYIDFITPEDLSAPVMRGVDLSERPFISLHVQSDEGERVVTYFQRNPRGGQWASGGALGTSLAEQSLDEITTILRQIVVDQNHPEFRLVTYE